MTTFLLGLFVGSSLGVLVVALLVAGGRSRELGDALAEIHRLRTALEYLRRSSRDATERRYISRVLDPDAQEVGA